MNNPSGFGGQVMKEIREKLDKMDAQEQAMATNGYLAQLLQLFQGVTWDGNLLSKTDRDALVKNELASQTRGYNLITSKGVAYLYELGLIHP